MRTTIDLGEVAASKTTPKFNGVDWSEDRRVVITGDIRVIVNHDALEEYAKRALLNQHKQCKLLNGAILVQVSNTRKE